MTDRVRALLSLVIAPTIASSAWGQTVTPPQPLSSGSATADQRAPAIAFDGSHYIVAFEEDTGTGPELRFVRIGVDGSILDPTPKALATGAGSPSAVALAYSPNGNRVVAVWTDPRDGTPDEIYGAAIADDVVSPAGGRRLTNNGADESSPAVTCGASGCLVTFIGTQSGRSRVFGLRLQPDGTQLDAAEIDLASLDPARKAGPAALALGPNYFVAFEDDRAGAANDLFAELYGRVVPGVGTVTSTGGVRLISAPFRQSEARMGELDGRAFLVWQDQRQLSTAGLDAFGASFEPDLSPRQPARVLASGPNDQLFPRVATQSDRGLVVFEDFRFGPIGQIQAIRVDATGAQEGFAFPVLSATATQFEHVVAKGPSNDYLVAAVTTGTPNRISYRIVRLELPAGTVTSVPSEAPADGITLATLEFGMARGPSGAVVVDGTPYTIASTSNDVEIVTQDLDPNQVGIQTNAYDGLVRVELRSFRAGTFDVNVRSNEGSSTGSATVTFRNVAPSVSDVSISPTTPGSDDDLVLSYRFVDVNGDTEAGTRIRWSNPALAPELDDQRTVPASATSRGQAWRAQIFPRDGDLDGPSVFSPTVTIGNARPAVQDVRIRPATGLRTGTALNGLYVFTDSDGDAEGQSKIGWIEDGRERPDLVGSRDVDGSFVLKGRSWEFYVEPNDGDVFGPRVVSAPVTVENSGPTAAAGSDGVVEERATYVLDANASNDPDGDSLSYVFEQIDGPAVELPHTHGATVAFVAPAVSGTSILQFRLTVSDGDLSATDAVLVEVRPSVDTDADGLDDFEERALGTRVDAADSDRDGLGDAAEVMATTAPLDADSDDDGVRDGAESDALSDTDDDGRINALDPDSDDDGVFDGTEVGVFEPVEGTEAAGGFFVADADRDTKTSPILADTDGDSLTDGTEDVNRNGRLDPGESDPLDGTSVAGCTSADPTCPADRVCRDGTCRAALPDAAVTCTALATRNLECCAGGCTGGTLKAPICASQGALETCTADSELCRIGSCSGADPKPAPSDAGCGCQSEPRKSSAWASLAFLLVLTHTRRRRNPLK